MELHLQCIDIALKLHLHCITWHCVKIPLHGFAPFSFCQSRMDDGGDGDDGGDDDDAAIL